MFKKRLLILSVLLSFGVASFAADFNVVININESIVENATNVILQWRVKGEDNSHWHSVDLTPDTQVTYTVTGVAEGVTYEFRVIVESEHGASSPSRIISGVSMETGPATIIINGVYPPPYMRTLSVGNTELPGLSYLLLEEKQEVLCKA